MNGIATTVSMLTPTGRGAVAVVEVIGTDAVRLVESHFKSASMRSLASEPIGKVLFGKWIHHLDDHPKGQSVRETESRGEELVICQVAQNRVEICCHGGLVAPQAIVNSLAADGCTEIAWHHSHQSAPDQTDWGECPISKSASIALTQATTQRTAAILMDQMKGALRKELESICRQIEAPNSLARINRLIDQADIGLHLTRPWSIVIAGPPNVGKSSLINALLGFERAIVFDQPGTTRDVVQSGTAFEGWPMQLSDTAGIHPTNDDLESAGIRRAITKLNSADLIVHVIDARESQSHLHHLPEQEHKRSIVVRNKVDLLDQSLLPSGNSELFTSAVNQQGISELIESIVKALIPFEPEPQQPFVFDPQQLDALLNAQDLIQKGKFHESQITLRRLCDQPVS